MRRLTTGLQTKSIANCEGRIVKDQKAEGSRQKAARRTLRMANGEFADGAEMGRHGESGNRGKGEMAHARGQIKWAEWIGTVVSRWGVVQTHLCPAHSDGRLEMGEKFHAQ